MRKDDTCTGSTWGCGKSALVWLDQLRGKQRNEPVARVQVPAMRSEALARFASFVETTGGWRRELFVGR